MFNPKFGGKKHSISGGEPLNHWEFIGQVLTLPSCCSLSLLPQPEVHHVAPAHWVTWRRWGVVQ